MGATGVALLVVGTSIEAQADLTPTRRFTITRQTKAIAKRIQSPVKVSGFVDPDGPLAVQMQALVRQYKAAHVPISLELVDPDAQPGRARAQGVTRYGQMLVELGGRSELVPDVEEVSLTSAILRLTRERPAVACFTIGHGEPDINDTRPDGYDGFSAYLRQLGYATEQLALGAPGATERLERCTVVITGPRIPFLPAELGVLADHVANRGRLLIMADPEDDARAQLNDLLRPYGLAFGSGTVRDRSSLADDPSSVVAFSYPSESPPIRDLKRDGIPVLFVDPHPIEKAATPEADEVVSPLVASSSQSSIPGNPAGGPFILSAVLNLERGVRPTRGDGVGDVSPRSRGQRRDRLQPPDRQLRQP